MKILIADTFPEHGAAALERRGATVVLKPGLKATELTTALGIENPDVLVVRSTKVEAEHMQAAHRLSLIVRAGAGVNTIDVQFASQRGIYVANCPGKNSIAVAELAFAHMLSIDRHIVDGANDLRNGRWNKKQYSNANGIYGQCLGLLGLGQIGREMTERALAFGMRVVGWSPSLDQEKADAMGIEFAATPLDVARACDVLSVHLALTKDTRGLVGETIFAALKPGAIFINTSRGEIVDEAALQRHVSARRIRAGLDVFVNEPTGSEGSIENPRFALKAIQGSHHIGASTEQAQTAVAEETVRIIESFLASGTVPNCVNLAARTPAKYLMVIRHLDRVGVLAGILDKLRRAEINVEEMENKIFLGGDAASARIQVAHLPEDSLITAISEQEHVLAVTTTEIH